MQRIRNERHRTYVNPDGGMDFAIRAEDEHRIIPLRTSCCDANIYFGCKSPMDGTFAGDSHKFRSLLVR
jgi:hypothetical protein